MKKSKHTKSTTGDFIFFYIYDQSNNENYQINLEHFLLDSIATWPLLLSQNTIWFSDNQRYPQPQCVMKSPPPWQPSVWSFARHWPARARPSTPLSPSVPPSPSPWPLGWGLQSSMWLGRRQAPQFREEMTKEENIFLNPYKLKLS